MKSFLMKSFRIGNLAVACLSIAIAGLTSVSIAEAEELREFTNSSGNKLKGKIISATNTEVTLQLENGRQVTGGIQFFSNPDQEFIQEWLKKNPMKISYDFEVDFSRERTDKKKGREGNLLTLAETWRYNVTIENRSKSGTSGTTVEGLELHYNLVKTPKAKSREAREINQGLSSHGATLVKRGKIELQQLGYLKDLEVFSETFPINHSELAPGWYYSDGSNDEANDVFDGIILQIVKDGNVIFQTNHGTNQVENMRFVPLQGSSR